MSMRFAGTVRLAVAASIALAGAPASVAAAPVATVTATTPVSGGGGWLVWSVRTPSGWALTAAHHGVRVPVPVAPRRQPFDAAVGTDARGAPVVTFSRCRGGLPRPGDAAGTLLEPAAGAGCRVRVIELDTMRERAVPIPHPARASDTTPAMWRGRIAFARSPSPATPVWQVMLYSPGRPGTLRVLPHGAVPPCPTPRCGGEGPAGGKVEALAFRGHTIAFVWGLRGPGLDGEEAWEDRVDVLGRPGRLAGVQLGIESCAEGGPVEEQWPLSPVLIGGAALFAADERGDCFTRFITAFIRYERGAAQIGTLGYPILAIADDGAQLYALTARRPARESEAECSAASPCSLEPIQPPPLHPRARAPAHPFL